MFYRSDDNKLVTINRSFLIYHKAIKRSFAL